MTRRLLTSLVGEANLSKMTPVGNKNRPGIPHLIKNYIYGTKIYDFIYKIQFTKNSDAFKFLAFVRKNMKLPHDEKWGADEFAQVLTSKCNTLRHEKSKKPRKEQPKKQPTKQPKKQPKKTAEKAFSNSEEKVKFD